MKLTERFGPIPVTTVLDGSGNGTVTFQPNGSSARISNLFVKVSTSVLQATCTIYKGQVADGNAINYTNSGSTGAPAGGAIDLTDGETVYVVWRGGDAGATATATFTGVTIPFDQVGPSHLDWDDPIAAGDGSLVYPALKSPNYVTGVSGWRIDRDGDAEFNDATFRGDVIVTDPDGSKVQILSGDGGTIRFTPENNVGQVVTDTGLIFSGAATDSFFMTTNTPAGTFGGLSVIRGSLFMGSSAASGTPWPGFTVAASILEFNGALLIHGETILEKKVIAELDLAVLGALDVTGNLSGSGTGSMDNPICKLIQQVAQTGLLTGSDTVLTFGSGSEDIDTHNFHDSIGAPTRVTPNIPGYYGLTVKPVLAFNTTTTALGSFFRKNGTIVERSGNTKPNATNNVNVTPGNATTILPANGSTDYFEGGVSFTATANQATNVVAGSESQFIVQYIRPL